MTKNRISYSKLFINDTELTYKIRYSDKAKYLRLQISNGKDLELIVPRGCRLKEAEKFVLKKTGWIEKHLSTSVNQEAAFRFLGKEIEISHEYELFAKTHQVKLENNELKILSPSGSSMKSEALYEEWLRQMAKIHLVNRAFELSGQLSIGINRVTIRGQKTRWGSCSSRGNLSFNYKLMKYKQEIIDYVIIHELCHRLEMNHSKKFWVLVAKYCPDYKQLKKELRGGIY